MSKLLKRYQPSWPAAMLASVIVISVAMVLTFAPENVQEKALQALGWIGYVASQFMGPIIRRHLAEQSEGNGYDEHSI